MYILYEREMFRTKASYKNKEYQQCSTVKNECFSYHTVKEKSLNTVKIFVCFHICTFLEQLNNVKIFAVKTLIIILFQS